MREAVDPAAAAAACAAAAPAAAAPSLRGGGRFAAGTGVVEEAARMRESG